MKRWTFVLGAALLSLALPAWAYIEAPYTLGRIVAESQGIVLVEVAQVNRERNLIIFKKLRDLKGKHAATQIKHNIGKAGFHPREWQTVMAWAAPGKKAVFFHNADASETCIGPYWYQCYRQGEWWGMSHAEPFLLRTYNGDAVKLADAVTALLQGKEVAVPCLADGPREQIQLRKGKMQIVRASLKRQDYNPKRDFVAWGGNAADIQQYKTVLVLPASSPDWRFVPAATVNNLGTRWIEPKFDDSAWRKGKAPIGYGEDEIGKRGGTRIAEKGQAIVFRRAFDVPPALLKLKGVTFHLGVASDDSATVYLNGSPADADPMPDHEFAYWNRDIELRPGQLRPGRNVVAVLVKNTPMSSDLYLDVEVSALVPQPKQVASKGVTGSTGKAAPVKILPLPPEKLPPELTIDRKSRTVSLPCKIAPRKLPHLKETYPIEVIATHPHPRGQKAHETVVTFEGVRPSMVHRALMDLGLKPGLPARGEGARPTGPALDISLEWSAGGKTHRMPLNRLLTDTRSGKALPAISWHFTGSAFRQPDPEKDAWAYGANLTGTLITIFPVTDEAVVQAAVPAGAEGAWRLEINARTLPRAGTPARLILHAK